MKTKRPIIEIDEALCDGCGVCVPSCAEGALRIIDGKARLVKEIYCDGLGACLGECPTGALTVVEREAESFDERAVHEYLAQRKRAEEKAPSLPTHFGGCPGSALREMRREEPAGEPAAEAGASALGHWPVQLMLIPPQAPFLQNADLLICADCVPFALPNFHSRYLQGKAVLVGCPKLDDLSYYQEKLAEIFQTAQPRKITVLRMEVPCCGGLAFAVKNAYGAAGLDVPLLVHTVGIQGDVLQREVLAGEEKAANE